MRPQAFGKRVKWGKVAADLQARKMARRQRAKRRSVLKGKSKSAVVKWFRAQLRLAKINLKTFLEQVLWMAPLHSDVPSVLSRAPSCRP